MKFDLPTTEAILKDLRDEVPYMYAAESNGVAYSTFKLWIENGKKEIIDGKPQAKYAQFLTAIRKIEKERIKGHVSNIRSGEKGHRGSEWILERAFWKQFGKASEIDLNERVEKLENKRNVNENIEAKDEQRQEVCEEATSEV